MNQLNLFKERVAPVARPSDPAFVRKHLNRLLNLVRTAERMPWGPAEAESWAKLVPELSKSLPAEEADVVCKAFAAEIERLRR